MGPSILPLFISLLPDVHHFLIAALPLTLVWFNRPSVAGGQFSERMSASKAIVHKGGLPQQKVEFILSGFPPL